MTLAIPVSSSIEMKMNPFAVPGRCRAMIQPAARTNSPSRRVRSSSADRIFCGATPHGDSTWGACQPSALFRHNRPPAAPRHSSAAREAPQNPRADDSLSCRSSGPSSLPARSTCHSASRRCRMPSSWFSAPICASRVSSLSVQATEHAGPGLRPNGKARLACAMPPIASAACLRQAFRIAEPDAQRKRSIAFVLDRAGPIRNLHIDRLHAQAMPLRVLHQHRSASRSPSAGC